MNGDGDILTNCLLAAKIRMLSVGSGDGSQQAAIVKQGHRRILVTFYDDKRQLLRKYPHAAPILDYLEKTCVEPPRFGVDATKLHTDPTLGKFDLIFFTFPHTGVSGGGKRSVSTNKELLRRFISSSSSLLNKNGEIQITLKASQFYTNWHVETLCATGLTHHGTYPLDKSLFPDYHHRLTVGMSGKLKELHDKEGAKVHVFTRKHRDETETDHELPAFEGKLLTVSQPSQRNIWNDSEVWTEIISILERVTGPVNILAIRRAFPCPVPETRQLNRVIYSMRDDGIVEQHPPDGSACRKPCWLLRD